jgi:GntR family transcriptional regulator, transcriptional repressor for pyruvate dehydrogenase complex
VTGTGNPAVARSLPFPEAWADELIRQQVLAARIACEQLTGPALKRLLSSVSRACSLPTKPEWERKAAAHAEIFRLLADVAGGPAAAGWSGGQTRLIRDLMRAVGPAVNGMITSSRRRLIDRLRAGDADGAAQEMEIHLRTLYYMWRLAQPGGAASSATHASSPVTSPFAATLTDSA